jgi:hypothetical protein
MKPTLSLAKVVFALALIVTIIGFSAFSQTTNSNQDSLRKEKNATRNDSSSPNLFYRNGMDRHLDQLDEQMQQLKSQMKNLSQQMKNFELDLKGQEHLKKSDLQKHLNEAFENINWERMSKDVRGSLTGIDKASMAEVRRQMEKVRTNLELRRRNLRIEVPKIDEDEIRGNIENAMKDARKSIEKAREKLSNIKEFTNELHKDGLIDKTKEYKIEVKEGDLYINDKKQSKETSEKYKQYYFKDSFTINNDGGVRI